MKGSRPSGRAPLTLALVAVVPVVALALAGYRTASLDIADEPPPADRPIEAELEGYVSSTTCRACHPSEYHTWHTSFHRTMTQLPGPDAVIPAFDDVVLTQDGLTYELSRRDGEYWIATDDPEWRKPSYEGSFSERPLALVTGSHNFQVYWTASGETRALSIFPFCYSIFEERWVPVDSIFIMPPKSKQRRDDGRWNITCIRCHATRGQPKVESLSEMDTLVAEFGIACESCHGPAEEHVRLNQNPLRRQAFFGDDGPDDSVVNPDRLTTELSSVVCGQCHSVTRPRGEDGMDAMMDHGYTYEPGEELENPHRVFIQEGETQFWSDGMVRVSGREYNGLVTSPCYTHGDEEAGVLSCMSCHRMHPDEDDPRPREEWRIDQLGVGMGGNAACTQCHPSFAEEAALVEHSRHPAESTGSLCYNCHMPHTTWGAVKAIRSHEVSSPSVAATLETGRPNACNLCHLDQTLAWTARELSESYGIPEPELDEDQRRIASSIRWTLTGDAGQRALMSWHFGWPAAKEASGTGWMAPYLAQLIHDPYSAVRNRAVRSLRLLPGFEDFELDSEAERTERVAARTRIEEEWSQIEREGAPELLIAPDGKLLDEDFSRLLRARDKRRVTLVE